jgi:hypothetical protein
VSVVVLGARRYQNKDWLGGLRWSRPPANERLGQYLGARGSFHLYFQKCRFSRVHCPSIRNTTFSHSVAIWTRPCAKFISYVIGDLIAMLLKTANRLLRGVLVAMG